MLEEVLLVADDFDFAKRVRILLESRGLKVLVVGTGRQAIALATLLLPAAIVLDADPPGVEGPHICQALRDRPVTQEIPLVVLGSRCDGLLGTLADAFVLKDQAMESCLPQALQRLGILADCQQQKPLVAGSAPVET